MLEQGANRAGLSALRGTHQGGESESVIPVHIGTLAGEVVHDVHLPEQRGGPDGRHLAFVKRVEVGPGINGCLNGLEIAGPDGLGEIARETRVGLRGGEGGGDEESEKKARHESGRTVEKGIHGTAEGR